MLSGNTDEKRLLKFLQPEKVPLDQSHSLCLAFLLIFLFSFSLPLLSSLSES
jgi:hypothetical protein